MLLSFSSPLIGLPACLRVPACLLARFPAWLLARIAAGMPVAPPSAFRNRVGVSRVFVIGFLRRYKASVLLSLPLLLLSVALVVIKVPDAGIGLSGSLECAAALILSIIIVSTVILLSFLSVSSL